MASGPPFDPALNLDANQQDLLMAALNSGRQAAPDQRSTSQTMADLAANGASEVPPLNGQHPNSSGLEGSLESPYLDYELDYDLDAGFDGEDAANGEMIGSLPGDAADDLHEKRKSFDGDDEDNEGSSKRQETEEKKKPGRRPLTSEPTTKRKAQNRAAQRAFRERKEKHLKDLEDKVSDLQKASESANNENSILKAQVQTLEKEVKEYRQRMINQASTNRSSSGGYSSSSWDSIAFDFPAFGYQSSLKPVRNEASANRTFPGPTRPTPNSQAQPQRSASQGSNSTAFSQNQQSFISTPSPANNTPFDFSDLFSPSMGAGITMSPSSEYGTHKNSVGPRANDSRNGSVDNTLMNNVPSLNGDYSLSNSASPSASSVSQHGPGSSTGTSPEPSGNSPANSHQSKLVDTSLKTINEESSFLNIDPATSGFLSKTPSADVNSFTWLAAQNEGQFAPDLFGDYRDPQDAIAGPTQDFNGFFNDAYSLPDFGNLGATPDLSPALNMSTPGGTATTRRDILSEVDAASNGEVAPAAPEEMLKMNQIWFVAQDAPHAGGDCKNHMREFLADRRSRDTINRDAKVQSGECDIDNLCKEMTKKARCTESGLKVPKKDVDELLKKGTNGMFAGGNVSL
ncbi:MAG: DNA-binding transcription factor yap1 [Vezdaea aestivalis]|nr:MAG: DNA-binding transcription factor yap1 [Vezdaea aestivalis]